MADVAVEDLRLVLEEEEWKPYGDGVRMVGEGYDYCIALPIPSVKHAKDEGKAEAVTQQQVQLLKDVRSQGLECKVIKSRDDDEYFVLIRASESLLDKAAEKMHNQYKVKPLRVLNKDDGSEYELNNMFLEYSLDKADMFENGGEHRRVPDAPVTSNMRASVRRQQIILALMKEDQPIGKELDFEKLRKKGVVNSIFPLHDEPCRRWLMENWATMKPGKPGVGRAWNFCIAKQPLDEIRNYYGEKVAMYFAWLGFYTQWLFFATVVSVCFGLFQMYVIYAEVTDDRVTPFYCLFLAVWATFYLEFWKRKCAALSHRWGVSDYSARETPRPEFVGVMKFNPYSGRDEEVNKKTWIVKILAGIPAVFLIIAVVLAAAISLLIYRFVIKYAFAGDTDTISYLVDGNSSATTCLPPHSYHNDTGACWATIEFVNYKKDGVCTGFCFLWEKASTGVLSAVLMMTMSMVYKRVAYFLNNWENHRLDSEYDNHLVAKTFIFQFINSYITLFWFAFRNSVQLCTNNFNEHLKIPCTEERTVDCSVANGTVALVREYDLIEREYQTNAYPIASNSCLQNLSLQVRGTVW
uniref:Anoctamin n=1 Tax=Palpitomonas bilix TaxID=652834 RepID=A0A7S3LXU2_9EUKA|mmetsp:Transcript_8699/g.23510  ORF Transcript_8699/g.23510 Transcript_8699/m.23510 type:complete len:580 (+) Transcript_8699:64-1803(+)